MAEVDYLSQFVDLNYIPPPKKIYKYEPYFEYRKQGLTDENVPDFAKVIFINPFIKNRLKQEFIDTFLLNYIKSKRFKDEYNGKYIVILNNLDYTIVNSIDESVALNDYQIGGKINIFIGELFTVRAGVSTVILKREQGHQTFEKIDGEKISVHKQETYKVKCGITHNETIQYGSVAYNKDIECLYDIGCEISYLFLPELWDFELNKFKDNIRNGTTEYWNKNYFNNTHSIYLTIADNNKTVVNLIHLKNPLYITINGLNPVPVYYLLIPLLEPEEESNMLFLIGLDIINQHSSIISKFNGKVELRITNQKEEIVNNFFT